MRWVTLYNNVSLFAKYFINYPLNHKLDPVAIEMKKNREEMKAMRDEMKELKDEMKELKEELRTALRKS